LDAIEHADDGSSPEDLPGYGGVEVRTEPSAKKKVFPFHRSCLGLLGLRLEDMV